MINLADAVIVDFPLRGEWVALNTPAERVPSHGTDYLGQRYAYDFCRFAAKWDLPYEGRFLRHLLATIPPQTFLCWSEPVFAAFDGTVIKVGDGWPDRRRINLVWELLRATCMTPRPQKGDLRPLAGNFVLVSGAPGVALYAHLREGSACVREGQSVRAGERLGAVGNSGNSTMPHLHFHLMDGADAERAAGRLCAFRQYERRREDSWEPVNNGVPLSLERIRVC